MVLRLSLVLALLVALVLGAMSACSNPIQPGVSTLPTTSGAPTTTTTTTTAPPGTTTTTTAPPGTTTTTTSPPGTTTTTTTSPPTTTTTTTTTTQPVVSFQTTIWNPGHMTVCGGCHAPTQTLAGARTFAIDRCVAGNPSGSLILQKPALASVTHAGGKPWAQATNPTAFNAVTNWINGGCAP